MTDSIKTFDAAEPDQAEGAEPKVDGPLDPSIYKVSEDISASLVPGELVTVALQRYRSTEVRWDNQVYLGKKKTDDTEEYNFLVIDSETTKAVPCNLIDPRYKVVRTSDCCLLIHEKMSNYAVGKMVEIVSDDATSSEAAEKAE